MSATRLRRRHVRTSWRGAALGAAFLCVAAAPAVAEPDEAGETPAIRESPARGAAIFAAGITSGLLAHEGGHLLFDVLFEADPGLRRVEFGGVPFFAITHRDGLSARREYAISSAGFWSQHALSEWLLTAHPHLRRERRPYLKGLLAWHVLSSAVYTAAAMGEIGPSERDTRGMAASLGVSERWVGVLLLVPAACDLWRYFDPDARLPRWVSRAAKAGLVVAVIRPRR